MKKTYSLAAAAALLSLASCSNNNDVVQDPTPTPQPTENTVISLGTRANTTFKVMAGLTDATDLVTASPVSTTPVETVLDRSALQTSVKNYLPEGTDNRSKMEMDFMYEAKNSDVTFTVYPIYMHTNQTHTLGLFYYDENGEKKEIANIMGTSFNQWNNLERTEYWPNNVTYSKGVKITVKKGYKFGFFYEGLLLAEGKYNVDDTKCYTRSSLNTASRTTDGNGGNQSEKATETNRAGSFVIDGKTYIGMEDWTDFDYQDIVLYTDAKLDVVTEPTDENIKPTPDATPTPDVTPTPTPDPDPTPTPTPTPDEDDDEDEAIKGKGSVEVNFSIDEKTDYADQGTASHLSVHVRDTTDFKIVIPVPAEVLCQEDDMMLVQKHEEGKYTYNERNDQMSITVNGQTVKINVKYAADGMTITSEGINAELLKYLRTTYGDGLTFEIRNRYTRFDASGKEVVTIDALKEYLDKSTITFTTNPAVYVQAVGRNDKGELDKLPCFVWADKNTFGSEASKPVDNTGTTASDLYIFDNKTVAAE